MVPGAWLGRPRDSNAQDWEWAASRQSGGSLSGVRGKAVTVRSKLMGGSPERYGRRKRRQVAIDLSSKRAGSAVVAESVCWC